MRRTTTAMLAGALAAAALGAAAGDTAHGGTAPADTAVAYQIDPAHDGLQTDPALAPPLVRRWRAELGGTPSYPLLAEGKVFVTAAAATGGGSTLEALDQADGHLLWSQAVPGTYAFSAAAYDGGRVFDLNVDGLLQAFDAGSGSRLWSRQLPGQWLFTSPPTAADGVVYTGGSGSAGTVYAVDESTGETLARQPVMNGDHSSPALSPDAVFVSYACDQAYGFTRSKLAPLWHDDTGCQGGGGKTAVYAGGNVFVRDFDGNLVLDAATGALVRSFSSATTVAAPAVDDDGLFVLGGGVLTAQNLSDGTSRWSFSGDGQLASAPILLATSRGTYVVEGSRAGTLYLLDAHSGAVAWSTNVGAPISAPDEQNALPLTGLAAGQGLLVVPAGNGLSAYAHVPPTLDSLAPAEGPVGTLVTLSGSGLTDTTGVSFAGAPAQFSVVSDTTLTATVPAGATSGPVGVTTPGGTATSSGAFTVTTPDFTLAASPATRSVAAGKTTSYTVSVTPSGGFAGTVSLSVTGLPAGVTAAFSPASLAGGGTATLTVQAARNAKSGTATLTIRGVAGGLSHTATVGLTITKK